jgi:hypothetical protein
LATAAGLWQRQRTQAREARASFRAQRVEALGLWKALSALEEAQRASFTRQDPSAADGANRLTQVAVSRIRGVLGRPRNRPGEL